MSDSNMLIIEQYDIHTDNVLPEQYVVLDKRSDMFNCVLLMPKTKRYVVHWIVNGLCVCHTLSYLN